MKPDSFPCWRSTAMRHVWNEKLIKWVCGHIHQTQNGPEDDFTLNHIQCLPVPLNAKLQLRSSTFSVCFIFFFKRGLKKKKKKNTTRISFLSIKEHVVARFTDWNVRQFLLVQTNQIERALIIWQPLKLFLWRRLKLSSRLPWDNFKCPNCRWSCSAKVKGKCYVPLIKLKLI